MLDAIVFDIGNVLLSFDFGRTFRRVAPACGVPPDQVVSRLNTLKGPLESGQISADIFLEKVARELEYRGDAAELRLAWQEIFEPIEQTHALVRRLHKRIPLYLLSNTNDLHTEYFLPKYPVFECFEDAIFSHEVQLMKPDPAIYTAALERFRIEPHKMLFIDDLAENVAAAAELGIHTHQYSASQHAGLERVVSECGL
jgi:HAD superfamily hydrolase (TIGR01509 family)